MGYTLKNLRTLTLSHLYRTADDTSIPDDVLVESINRCRRNIWRDLGQAEAQTVTYNIVSGQSDYILSPVAPSEGGSFYDHNPDMVSGVAVRETSSSTPAHLTRANFRDLIKIYDGYPDNPTGATVPAYYSVRVSTVDNSDTVTTTPYTPQKYVALSLYPTPGFSTTDGLIVFLSAAALDLTSYPHVSSLPREVDDAATWRAALELIPFIYLDERAPQLASVLATMATRAEDDARRVVYDSFGVDEINIITGQSFASEYDIPTTGTERPYGYSSVGASSTLVPSMVSVSKTVSVDATAVDLICPSTQLPIATTTLAAFSNQQGLITNAVLNGTTVTVTADAGMTFYAGDVITVFYESYQ